VRDARGAPASPCGVVAARLIGLAEKFRKNAIINTTTDKLYFILRIYTSDYTRNLIDSATATCNHAHLFNGSPENAQFSRRPPR
jgi:hypothetical protein